MQVQGGSDFSPDNYLVKLMSDQRYAFLKKMVHQPRASGQLWKQLIY